VTVGAANAAPIVESGDFGNDFVSRTLLTGQGPVSGALGGADLFDYFQLSGFGAGQTVRITLTQIAQLPDPSGSASGSGDASSSGSEPSGSASASEPVASASDSGGSEPEASASGSEEPTASASASGSEDTSTPKASGSEDPADVGFTLHLLEEVGAFLAFPGDSGPNTETVASASGEQYPENQVFGNRSYSFDLDATTLPAGDLNLRLAFDGTGDAFYQVTVSTQTSASIPEPSSLAPLAAGAAGLGFMAARRRRRKK